MSEETTKKSFWSKIDSLFAFVGALFKCKKSAEHIEEQKEKAEEVKELAAEAIEAVKEGDAKTAEAATELIVEPGKEIIDNTKEAKEKLKKKINFNF